MNRLPHMTASDELDPEDLDSEKIAIQLNGEPRRLVAGSTLLTLLEGLGRDPRTVAVELNRRIVRRQQLAAQRLEEGDEVEVVHFVQGG